MEVFSFLMFSRKGLLMTDRKAGIGIYLCGGFWNESEYLLLPLSGEQSFAYQYNLILEDTAKHFIIWERYYSEEEITSILRKVGFRKISIYKELLGKNDFTSSSEFL